MIQESSENKAKTCEGFLGLLRCIFHKKLRIGASTGSFLRLSDFSSEHSKTKLFEALLLFRFYSSTIQEI